MPIKIPIRRANVEDEIYFELVGELEEMRRQGADRVIISLEESEPNPDATGRWLTEEDMNYYPFGVLTEREQKMIRAGDLHYVTAGTVPADGGMRRFSAIAAENGWSAEEVKKRFDDGLKEYHAKTKSLMENAGVYKALELMESKPLLGTQWV